jgi:hypothetical protein
VREEGVVATDGYEERPRWLLIWVCGLLGLSRSGEGRVRVRDGEKDDALRMRVAAIEWLIRRCCFSIPGDFASEAVDRWK